MLEEKEIIKKLQLIVQNILKINRLGLHSVILNSSKHKVKRDTIKYIQFNHFRI
jgi:hypothetical protein